MRSDNAAQRVSPSWWIFLQQWLKNPLRTAAIAPSGPELVAAMIAQLPHDARRIIELGGGTGAMTDALLRHGIAPDDLLVLELNAALHERLHRRLPEVRVVHGDARRLTALTVDTGYAEAGLADAIISGLGLLSMPTHVQRDIFTAAFAAMRNDGVLVQFTYGPSAPLPETLTRELGLQARRGSFVLRNVPPATVYVYSRISG